MFVITDEQIVKWFYKISKNYVPKIYSNKLKLHLPVILISDFSEVWIGFGAAGGGCLDVKTKTEESENILAQPLYHKKTYFKEQLQCKLNVRKLQYFLSVQSCFQRKKQNKNNKQIKWNQMWR